MSIARRQTLLFLACAVVLLGAGFACGWAYSYDGFYSSESQLERELSEMDFNSRLLHYANIGHRGDCRRELVRRLNGQVVFVNNLLASCQRQETRMSAQASVKQAQEVISGHPINAIP